MTPTPASKSDNEDSDDDAWIPLSSNTTTKHNSSLKQPTSSSPSSSSSIPNPTPNDHKTHQSSSSSSSNLPKRGGKNFTSKNNNNDNNDSEDARLEAIQRKLENRIHLQSNLVDHPMDLFWKRYLWNLACEIWALELHVRLGIALVLMGILLKIILLSTWYVWYPKCALLLLVLILSVVYLEPLVDIKQHITKTLLCIDHLQHWEQWNIQKVKRLAAVLLFVPTALEMRTLSFLSQVHAESGWTFYNTILALANLSFMLLYSFRQRHKQPKECLYQGLLVLYGSALMVTMIQTDLHRLPLVAAPFFTATGTLLITYQDDDMEWMSRVLRHALRLTLKDVLTSMSERVSQDEMLQLAILRWIVDYWAYSPQQQQEQQQQGHSTASSTPAPPPSNTTPNNNHGNDPPFGTTSSTRPETTSTSTPSVSENTSSSSMPPSAYASRNPQQQQQRRQPRPFQYPRHEVQWDELLPMLNIATDHMSSEMQLLQSEEPRHHNPNDNRPNAPPPAGTSHPQNDNNFSHHHEDDPFESLRDMLKSLNVDEQAKPAVDAYGRAVESLPPEPTTAFWISILRRCPASLTLVWHLLIVGSRGSLISTTMLLVPFILMEYYRIQDWMAACTEMGTMMGVTPPQQQQGATERRRGIPPQLANMDPMMILLCGDNFNPVRPPTLLLVWGNIQSSVGALRVGLTAARCVQTTAVAVSFAGNVMSLLEFGQQVHQNGLLHGLAVVATEIITMHMLSQQEDGTQRGRKGGVKYTRAAMEAVENAQAVAKNVQSLADDEHLGFVIQPIVWTACTISGYGWLWGREENTQEADTATNETPTDNAGTTKNTAEVRNDGTEPMADSDAKDSKDEKQTDIPTNKTSTHDKDTTVSSTEEKNDDEEAMTSTDGKDAKDAIVANTSEMEDEGNELSNVMEMIASAREQGLIDQAEKDHFCEKLSQLSESEITDPVVLEGIKRSLRIILDNGSAVQVNDMNISDPVVESDPQSEMPPPPSERVHPSALLELVLAAYYDGKIDVETKKEFCRKITALNDNDKSDPKDVEKMMSTLRDIADGKVSMNSQKTNKEKSASGIDTNQSDENDGDSEQNWQPLPSQMPPTQIDIDEKLSANMSFEQSTSVLSSEADSSSSQREDLGGPSSSMAGEERAEGGSTENATRNDDSSKHDTWATLATIGVLVGGVLLAGRGGDNHTSNNENEGGTEADREDHPNTTASTVQIEELEDDKEEDWVSIRAQ